MKQEKETIKMAEDTFIKRHAKKILVAGTIVTATGLIYISKKHGVEINLLNSKIAEVSGIGLRSLHREKANAEFEIETLREYIDKLDPNYNINVFVKIPEAKARIAELETFIKEIISDIKRLEG